MTGLYIRQIFMKHLGHGRTRDVGTFLGHTRSMEITTRMLGITHVDIADNIYDTAVGFFGQALIKTTITCFHVEDRDMQTLSTDNGEAAIGIA